MMRLSLNNFANDQILDQKQMKQINGGMHQAFECYCGHVGGQYEHMKFVVYADDVIDALNSSSNGCGGYGVTCSGIEGTGLSND